MKITRFDVKTYLLSLTDDDYESIISETENERPKEPSPMMEKFEAYRNMSKFQQYFLLCRYMIYTIVGGLIMAPISAIGMIICGGMSVGTGIKIFGVYVWALQYFFGIEPITIIEWVESYKR